MDLTDWAREIAEKFKASCGDRGRFIQMLDIPHEAKSYSPERWVHEALVLVMPGCSIHVRVDSYSRLVISKRV